MMESVEPGSWQEITAIAALFSVASTSFAWIVGRRWERARTAAAIARDKAEAKKAEAETVQILKVAEKASAKDFEAAVNERVKLIFEEQNSRIAQLTAEVHALRQQVETLTTELHKAKRAQRSPAPDAAG